MDENLPKKRLIIPEEPKTPLDALLRKLENWLLMQPEFVLLLDAPRATRRKAAQQLAKHILSFPKRGTRFGPIGG